MGPFIPRRGTVNADEDRPGTQGHMDGDVEGGRIVCECGWVSPSSVANRGTTARQVSDEWHQHQVNEEFVANLYRRMTERMR